jgi:hypothetical protein
VTAKVKGIVDPIIQEPDVYAFLALQAGTASPEQQRRVGDWLLIEACRVLSPTTIEVKNSGSTDLAHDLAFAEGRRYVGILIREMTLPATLDKAKTVTAIIRGEPAPTRNSKRSTPRGKQ